MPFWYTDISLELRYGYSLRVIYSKYYNTNIYLSSYTCTKKWRKNEDDEKDNLKW